MKGDHSHSQERARERINDPNAKRGEGAVPKNKPGFKGKTKGKKKKMK